MTAHVAASPHLQARSVLSRLRQASPRIHAIVNRVASPLVANVLLAVGASPAMAHADEEVAAFVRGSRALLVNLGTPDESVMAGICIAVEAAREARIPWALDPVGVAASPWRLATARDLLAFRPAVIRGNADEVMALARGEALPQGGIDAISPVASVLDAAVELARRTGAVVAVTGPEDVVLAPGAEPVTVVGGHPMSRLVSGSGCAATALVAAALAVATAREAAMTGLAAMKAAAAEAGRSAKGPGSFAVGLIDALHRLSLVDSPAASEPTP